MSTITASNKLIKSLNKKVSIKQQYINELEHDAQWFRELLMRKDRSHFWVHGDLCNRKQISGMLSEITSELNKINLDKNYKPWKL